jgi:heat shock protein HslJ
VILIPVSFIAFSACGVQDSGASDTSLADGPRWVLESIDSNPPIEGTFLWLKLNGDSSGGFDGCNTFGGRSEDGESVARADGTFLSPPYSRTLIGCEDLVNDQSDAYLDTLDEGRRFRVSDGRLEILDGADVTRLAFVEQFPLPGELVELSGTAWRLLAEEEDVARPATLVFLSDHWGSSPLTWCGSSSILMF